MYSVIYNESARRGLSDKREYAHKHANSTETMVNAQNNLTINNLII
ncbi:hypothetical protein SAMN05421545_2616 [Pontibacter lucknowensis]|uniref:Uncharacterized protein n=1 Tax=Pontibacter lucknowensis TaxID=1077936 RepID=A0A1N6YNF0_9BACT|nr:hypothetical protein SAMN05421545_2616 [Pontibacter lucknowensis]